MTFLISTLWITLNTLLLNIAIQIGWGVDPGYAGPAILIIIFNLTVALYSTKKSGS